MPWKYDKGGEENRRKHAWKHAHAGFIELKNGDRVGKCPNGTTPELRERLVNEAIPFDGDDLTAGARPTRLYIVHEGVVYRAKATNSTVGSWHAFPEFPEELQKLPRQVWNAIRERARTLGCLEQVEKWRKG